jgi:hypothetical protein
MADKIVMRPVEALIPYTRNARTHSRVAARVAGPGRDCIGLELSPGLRPRWRAGASGPPHRDCAEPPDGPFFPAWPQYRRLSLRRDRLEQNVKSGMQRRGHRRRQIWLAPDRRRRQPGIADLDPRLERRDSASLAAK